VANRSVPPAAIMATPLLPPPKNVTPEPPLIVPHPAGAAASLHSLWLCLWSVGDNSAVNVLRVIEMVQSSAKLTTVIEDRV